MPSTFYFDNNIISNLQINNLSNSNDNKSNILDIESSSLITTYYISNEKNINEKISYYYQQKIKKTINNKEEKIEMEPDEAYLTISPNKKLYIDIGKKNIRWGTSYAWNIVNIFDNENRFTKIENNFNNTIYAEYFIDNTKSISFNKFINNNNNGLKLHFNKNNIDINTYYLNINNIDKIGVDSSITYSDPWEFHIETLFAKGTDKYYPSNPTSNIYQWEQSKEKSNAIFTELVIGTQYTTLKKTNIVFEYFHNPTGLNSEEYNILLNGINESIKNDKYLNDSVWKLFIVNNSKYYEFTRYRQNYFLLNIINSTLINSVTLELTTYYSLDDYGFLTLPSFNFNINQNTNIKTQLFIPIGSNEIEFKKFYDQYIKFKIEYIFS